MSQNQSYFWQTTRHNVYLKRSAKWHMALALMVVLTFATICAAEFNPDADDNDAIIADLQKVIMMWDIICFLEYSHRYFRYNFTECRTTGNIG